MEAFVAASDLPRSPGPPFCTSLSRLLVQYGFDRMVEKLCDAYCSETMGRPGVQPDIFLRMLLLGYFEGLALHLAISWRCGDSRSLDSSWVSPRLIPCRTTPV